MLHNDTPDWLEEKWINTSEVCLLLYGSKDKSTTAQFAMKKTGKRPWKEEELQRLEAIRETFEKRLAQKKLVKLF